MAETQTGVRLDLAADGAVSVATGLPVLDHLVGQLAQAARFRLTLEVAPESTDESVAAAGRALGRAIAEKLDAGRGWAVAPADEALALCALERVDEPRLVTNVDFSG